MMPNLPSLHVIQRTHSTGNFRSGVTRLTDPLGGKPELVARSLRSVARALSLVPSHLAHLSVLDDHSDAESVAKMKEILQGCSFPVEFISLENMGNMESMRSSFERGLHSKEKLCYFVEDDWLHEETALVEMLETYRIAQQQMRRDDIALFPLDNIWRYGFRGLPIPETRIVLGSRRHWRTVKSATSTFLLPRASVEKYWAQILKGVEDGSGDQSTNVLWENYVPMLSPIPTLAYHIHDIPDTPSFNNWRALWERLVA